MDPARPGFQSKKRPSKNVLDTDDAEFVDIIHSNNVFGFSKSLGHVDFWPNGKRFIQLGCKGGEFNKYFSFETILNFMFAEIQFRSLKFYRLKHAFILEDR